MLQSLSVASPDQLWRIRGEPHCCDWTGYSLDSDEEPRDWTLFFREAYRQFRVNTPGFQDMAALQAGSMPLRVLRSGSSGSPDSANGELSPATFMLTAIGLNGAGYLLTSQLFGVTPWDPLLLAG